MKTRHAAQRRECTGCGRVVRGKRISLDEIEFTCMTEECYASWTEEYEGENYNFKHSDDEDDHDDEDEDEE